MIAPLRSVKRVGRAGLRRVVANPRLRTILESEIRRLDRLDGAATPTPLPSFTDRHGTTHDLDPGLRDRLKPAWRVMCDPVAAAAPASDERLRDRARKAALSATEVDRLLAHTAGASLTGRILEIGCYDGAVSFEIAKRPGTEVVASDLARYYVVQRPGQPLDAAVEAEEIALAALRDRARTIAGVAPGRVTFVEDDITTSTLAPASFDVIVSFEVLEHVARPDDAVAAMARLLRPGGIMVHDYNPFLSSIGGHSLVTLDFPWGHARLDAEDLERYLREIRPSEADQAGRFYRESLNRMTLADLRRAIGGAGLEPLALLPWYQRSLLPRATPQVLDEVRRVYPSATIDDLLATFVSVVARRPTTDA